MSYPYPVSVIPGPNDLLSQSQGQIQTNFANILGWSGVDHVAYGATNAGFHKQVTFPDVSVQAPPTDPEAILYTKNDGLSHPQLFFLNSQNNGFYIPSANGSTVLMGGILMQWGSIVVPAGGSALVTFPVAFPAACFNVQVTVRAIGAFAGGCGVPSLTGVTLFLVSNATPSQTLYWTAIGN